MNNNYTVPFVRIFGDPVEELEIQNAQEMSIKSSSKNLQNFNAIPDYSSINSQNAMNIQDQYINLNTVDEYMNSVNATEQYINLTEQYIPPRNI